MDDGNLAYTVETLDIKIVLINGRLTVYPREYQVSNILCSSGKQMFFLFNVADSNWTIGCCINFGIFKERLRQDLLHRERYYTLEETGITDVVSDLEFLFSSTKSRWTTLSKDESERLSKTLRREPSCLEGEL